MNPMSEDQTLPFAHDTQQDPTPPPAQNATAVQTVLPDPDYKYVGGALGGENLFACSWCGCLVLEGYRHEHTGWHKRNSPHP